jgi:hypothetical protein
VTPAAHGSVAPQPVCPTLLRALFNYLGLEYQVAQGHITARPRPCGPSSELREYFDQSGVRFALAQRRRASTDPWDPKNFWFDGTAWRSFQVIEQHRCLLCVLAGQRPLITP